ncbi:hypothetical protein LIER_31183 [Lithospermum erythrorhizon]|uniref:PDZ domain-containing protein n=1 Tax=Lithospermum erythrorhizon TaxID=34254 RepID=A0AAV3RTV3_LITER
MSDYCAKKKYPWFRENIHDSICYGPKFAMFKQNVSLDIDTKRAVLKAASSVVALLSYTGDQELTECSGVIIENDATNAHIVLTSAKLIRRPTKQNVLEDHLANNLKVVIYMYHGGSYEGLVCAYDFHYNIAWIRFESDSSIPTARLRLVDDFINVNRAEEKSVYLRPHSTHFKLVPGGAIVGVGRYFSKPFDLMAAPGEFIVDRCFDEFDCNELLLGTHLITRCGEGGPLINLSGEVIGISFYETGLFTPFLPINIAQKSWEHYKVCGEVRRPFLGIVATNLWVVDISHVERVLRMVPSIGNGVHVEKVIEGSSFDSAGLLEDDAIVQCGGSTVHSFMEFFEMLWDKKVGDVLQLGIVRACENELIHVNLVFDEVVQKCHRWPRT